MTEAIKTVRKGDTVVVLAGKDKGRRGKVLRTLPDENKVLIENLNVAKRHTRPTKTAPQGGIVEKPMPVPASKVMVVCGKCNKPTRVGRKVDGDETTRVCKKCSASLDK